ncbi:lipase family protein [Nocardia sp. NPDC058705]|uniref:lipase family protein n=1 Tax=Nocardia sp. NPDC058705 TaxID=3346609 RepID=UPI0036819E70
MSQNPLSLPSSAVRTWRTRLSAVALAALTLTAAASGSTAAQPNPADGTIIAAHQITPFGLPVPAKAWQLSFTSQDGNNRPTTGKTTIIEPDTPWTGPGARPLVSWQVAEDSLGSHCAPSYTLERDLVSGFNPSTIESALAVMALQRNWAVAYPDVQGPQARFLDKTQAAHAILDGVRAAKTFAPAGLSDSPVALLGYSGGAMVSLWAEQELPRYAPELELAGIAVGGMPVQLNDEFDHVSGTVYAGIGLLGIAAIHRIAPEADIPALLNDRGKHMLAETANYCLTDFMIKYPFANINDYTAVPNIFHSPRVQAVTQDLGQQPSMPPRTPTYYWQSALDDILPIESTDRLVHSWCQAGGQVTYARLTIPGHGLPDLAHLPPAFDFLGDRFADATPPPCG